MHPALWDLSLTYTPLEVEGLLPVAYGVDPNGHPGYAQGVIWLPIIKRFEFNTRCQKEGEKVATFVAALRS